MKHFICMLFLAVITFSCINYEDSLNEFPQTWTIVGWQDFSLGEESVFLPIKDSIHFYVFNLDGTFVKTVGSATTKGRYRTEIIDYQVSGKRKHYSLIFPDEELINSCSKVKEYLFVDNDLLVSGDAACNGSSTYFSLVTD